METKEKYKRLGYRDYNHYLKGFLWKTTREKVLFRDNRTCQICEKTEDNNVLNVHHIRYDNDVLSGENLTQLITLCTSCHDKLENTTKNLDEKEYLLNQKIYESRGLDLEDLKLKWKSINLDDIINPRLKARMEKEREKRHKKLAKQKSRAEIVKAHNNSYAGRIEKTRRDNYFKNVHKKKKKNRKKKKNYINELMLQRYPEVKNLIREAENIKYRKTGGDPRKRKLSKCEERRIWDKFLKQKQKEENKTSKTKGQIEKEKQDEQLRLMCIERDNQISDAIKNKTIHKLPTETMRQDAVRRREKYEQDLKKRKKKLGLRITSNNNTRPLKDTYQDTLKGTKITKSPLTKYVKG